jgi:phosphate transport system permease protein
MSLFSELMNRKRVVRARQRKAANAVMLGLTGFLTLLALVPLFWIVGYVVIRGGKSINLDFFLHMPTPMGVTGGGVRTAIEGTLVVTLLAAIFAIPPGVLAAFYAARYPNTPLGVALRFSTDVLSGVPSIVVGLFAYTIIVIPMHHYSGLAGGAALAILMLPTIIRTTEEMLAGTWRTRMEDLVERGFPGGSQRDHHRFPAGARPGSRGDRASAYDCTGQRTL